MKKIINPTSLSILAVIVAIVFGTLNYNSTKPKIEIDVQYNSLKIIRNSVDDQYLKDNKTEYDKFLRKQNLPSDDAFISEYLFLMYRYFKYDLLLRFIIDDADIRSNISDQNAYFIESKFFKIDKELKRFRSDFDVVLPFKITASNNGGSKTSLISNKIVVRGFGITEEKTFTIDEINLEIDAGANMNFNSTLVDHLFYQVFLSQGITPVMNTLFYDLFGDSEKLDDELNNHLLPYLKDRTMFDTVYNSNKNLEIKIIFNDQHGNEWVNTSELNRDAIFKDIRGLDELLDSPSRIKKNTAP